MESLRDDPRRGPEPRRRRRLRQPRRQLGERDLPAQCRARRHEADRSGRARECGLPACDGGGLNAAFSKFIVRDCVFSENQCDWYGGGWRCSTLRRARSTSSTPSSSTTPPGVWGAVATYTTSPRFINCYQEQPRLLRRRLYINQNCEITNCTIMHNMVFGSAVASAGIYNNGGSGRLNSIIRDNRDRGTPPDLAHRRRR